MQKGFVYLDEFIQGIRWDCKYSTWDNFIGKPVNGYETNRIIVTTVLAKKLLQVHTEAQSLGYGLLIWDGYRTQRAVDNFLEWALDSEIDGDKSRYYPNMSKTEMVSRGYIASKSSHSKGIAVDLTLYQLKTNRLLPMGTEFDFMDVSSHHYSKVVSAEAQKNRMLLKGIMEKFGFESLKQEWWHYSLKDEIYPNKYFDFLIS
ncbi:M15 family metallopeptidase [Listeria valentina]|uniref:M15 family metallopeptidase n=1 Tax=Listeria valentina TaxID=2705293 RepID=UPI00142FE9CB|nr:M15 family metallopeptidase [Listeria valentina]